MLINLVPLLTPTRTQLYLTGEPIPGSRTTAPV